MTSSQDTTSDTFSRQWSRESLPNNLRKWVRETTQYLTDLYQGVSNGDGDIDFYKAEKERALDKASINWRVEGSERTVIGVGKTWGGGPIFGNQQRVVLKIQPSAPVTEHDAANQTAIQTYDQILENGDSDLVSSFIEAGNDGAWIAQDYAVPINPPRGDTHSPSDWIRDTADTAIRDRFKATCRSRGLSVNVGRGNVGIDNAGTAVLLDIGGHTHYRD